jgi:hypothetical protein
VYLRNSATIPSLCTPSYIFLVHHYLSIKAEITVESTFGIQTFKQTIKFTGSEIR